MRSSAVLAPGNQNSVSGAVQLVPSRPRPVPAATSVVSWTVQPGANLPSAVPTRAGASAPELSPVAGLPGSFDLQNGLCRPCRRAPPSADSSVATWSSALPLSLVPSETGVKDVYAVSARSEVLGCGQSRLVRSTGSWAAAFAVPSPDASGALQRGEAGDGGERGRAGDQGQGGAVHCWLPSGRSLSVPCGGCGGIGGCADGSYAGS